MSVPSDFLVGSFMILVYPPWRDLYRGAMVSQSTLVSRDPPMDDCTFLRAAIVPSLAEVTSFSAKGLNALALVTVVVIRPLSTRDLASERIRDWR